MEIHMDTQIIHDIKRGLEEKRANLTDWQQVTPPAKKQIQLGMEDESCLEPCLEEINASLEKVEDGTLGLCEVCHEMVEEGLLLMDYTACVCLSHFSDEERRQLESELELSQLVQRGMLPQQVPSTTALDIAAFSRPAQIISGDYFDFFQFDDGALGLVMADVSGHGVSAGMLMTSLQTAFHALLPDNNSPVEILRRINHLYAHNIRFTTFVTVFFGRLDLHSHTFTYANAGHNPALFVHRKGASSEWLNPTGRAIGLLHDDTLHAHTITVDQGDILLLYTDGITEAMNPRGEMFGQERLGKVIQAHQDLSAEEVIAEIREALEIFTAGHPLVDDTTLVVCKIR